MDSRLGDCDGRIWLPIGRSRWPERIAKQVSFACRDLEHSGEVCMLSARRMSVVFCVIQRGPWKFLKRRDEVKLRCGPSASSTGVWR